MKAITLVNAICLESVDLRDEGVAGEMVSHRQPALGFISVYPGVETTQTPDNTKL